ncbi:meckelin-like [Portunus trituberculatus]|uniref:Meckelin n=1 Tax=Portunus trituberculatus TaxID=210409 RepID=A0A5B7EM53_PORTR|nr:meckelin-like [Portunus trituberculatus]MPC34408.1 Meckelin [Portunus trituberculatus]
MSWKVILAVYILTHQTQARNFEFITYHDLMQCQERDYFNPVTLQCTNCPPNQTVYDNPYTCECLPRFKSLYKGKELICEPCPALHVTSNDKRTCIPCLGSAVNETLGECDPCPLTSQVMADKAVNGTSLGGMMCVKCSNDTVPGPEGCVPCHASYYAASGGFCVCPETHEELGGTCVPLAELSKIPDRKSTYTVQYNSGLALESAFLKAHFRAAAHSCTFQQNKSACHTLSNMCVLLHYEFDGDFNACQYYREEFGENYITLPDHVPWLYYPEGEANVYTSKTKLKTTYSFNDGDPNSSLNFTVAKYSADGHLLEYGRLEEVLTLCPLIDFRFDAVVKFGMTFSQRCFLNVKDLWDTYETVFYDVFLQYYDKEEHMMYAVPILNRNYKEDGVLLNQESKMKWQLTRRFFLIDNLSGREAGSPNAWDELERARVVQYVKNMEIIIQLREGEGHGLIYPPLFKLTYDEVEDNYYDSNRKVEVGLKVQYTMNFSKIQEDLSIAIGVVSCFAVLWSVIATWSWFRRCGRVGLDVPTIFHFVIMVCGNLASMFWLVMFFSCLYWTIFFKRQDVVHLFLLTQHQETVIKQYLIAAWFLKLVQVVYVVYVQITIDMFIIDWEQPRARNSIPHPQLNVSLDDEGKQRAEQPISIWRTYFIANEWNELQTHRKVNVGLQLFLTLLFLKVMGFENLSVMSPDSSFHDDRQGSNVPQSFVCRFAISISIYLAIVMAQWLFKLMIYERYVENKLQQFIDLCSIANISIFILEHKMYGYYIHGRSAHGFADVDMQSIYEQMKREEEDLCGHRGLEPSSECQTFEVMVTPKFREKYDTILRPLHRRRGLGRPAGRIKMASDQLEQSFQAHEALKRFFGMFLQHALKNLDYIIKEKLFLEGLLDLEFQETDDRCLLFRDNKHTFRRVLFYGHEATFVLFEMLLFTFIDIVSGDFVLAAVVTYALVVLLEKVCSAGGRNNVVHKTLVDQRFLM